MSIRVMTRIWEASSHSGTELLMLLALADFSDDDGISYPSVGKLAKKCRTTPRHANRLIAALAAGGELEVLQGRGPAVENGRLNLFRIRIEGLTNSSGVTVQSGVTRMAQRGDAQVLGGVTVASDKPSLKRQEPPVDGLFEQFYEAYPRKVKPKDARRAWDKLKPDSDLLDQMLAAIAAQSTTAQWQKNDGQFIPYPATWLNSESWKNEVGVDGSAVAKPWHETRSGIEATGVELGIGKWDEQSFSLGRGEAFPQYAARVFKAADQAQRAAP